MELTRRGTIRDVAKHLGAGWDLIYDIQKRNLSQGFAKPRLKHPRHIAIDEIGVSKGHRNLTLVMDLESGAVVHVGVGKGSTFQGSFGSSPSPAGRRSKRWRWR